MSREIVDELEYLFDEVVLYIYLEKRKKFLVHEVEAYVG